MSKKIRKKAVLAFAIEIICLVLLGALLFKVQTTLSVEEQKSDTAEKLVQTRELINRASAQANEATESYDKNYYAQAQSIAYMYQKQITQDRSDSKMLEFKNLLGVNNVLILDKYGNQAAKAKQSPSDFTQARFNQLRTVFEADKSSEVFSVLYMSAEYRYYGAKIDEDTMVVLEQSSEELDKILEQTDTWESMLSNVSVGLDGYAFAVSKKSNTFLYHPNSDLVGKDVISAGIQRELLEEGTFDWMKVNGERLYAGVTELDDAYLVCAVSEKEIASSRNITVGVILFVFFAVLTLAITYALLLMRQEKKDREAKKTDLEQTDHRFCYNSCIGHKMGAICIVGLLAILVISFYMQTLFSLSRQSMSNNQRTEEAASAMEADQKEIELITQQYNDQYLSKCKIAAYIVQESPAAPNRESLTEMSEMLGVEAIDIYDSQGVKTATNSPFTKFSISQDEEDQSYEFNRLLQGADYLIQDAQPDDTSGELRQYFGVTIRNENGDANGFVQIYMVPSKLDDALKNMQIEHVLADVKVGNDGFAFAVKKDDQTFAYYPKKKLIGKSALENGIEEKQLKDGYCDYLTINSDTYYGSSVETDDYYIYVVVPDGAMNRTRMPITLATGGAAALSLLMLFLLLTLSVKKKEEEPEAAEAPENDRVIDVVMPDGSVKKTESAASRWENLAVGWSQKTPEEQIGEIMKGLLAVLTIAICVAILFKDTFFDSNSIFRYVLNGHWEKGFNIFAFTGCIMIVCAVTVITIIIREILKILSRTFGARGETICRLLRSFIKYFSVIAVLYYSLALFGVDTKTLLASAGILTLVVGLGAKTLVADILAGLFIIFEGEFQVGDIVTISGYRGTVVEIGVRTTKIQDGSQNIKIISNSQVSGVINMTRQYSYCWCDVGIEYGESLERVENILQKEFPNIKKRQPKILDGPFYKGVVSLGDNSVNIRIMVLCAEGDRIQMERDLNREIKLMFDKNDINIPFPQVVLNQPAEFQKATVWEKYKADKFNEEQKELSKDLAAEQKEN